MPLRSAGLGLLIVLCVTPTTRAENPAAPQPVEGALDAGAAAHPGTNRPCFPVSVPVWSAGFHGDDYVTGWGSLDRTARSPVLSCEVKGWTPIDPCGRTVSVYLAKCPDGVFTFTKTEADCYQVLGCRDPHATAGYGAAAR